MNETLLDISRQFWEAMEHADEVGMRACAHPDCNFVHIGITCKLEGNRILHQWGLSTYEYYLPQSEG